MMWLNKDKKNHLVMLLKYIIISSFDPEMY